MDENLFYDQQSFTMNYSQPVSTHFYNSSNMTTSESLDFSTAVKQPVTELLQDVTVDAAYQVATHIIQHQHISYLKFYHFLPNDKNFYYITCKMILQDSEDHGHYNHGFFFQHPNDPSTEYYVTCKFLPYHLIENILNNGMDFDVIDLKLSLHQKLNIEKSLKQKLFDLIYCNYCNGNANSTTQINSMADIQNYNSLSDDHIVQDADDIFYDVINPQQIVDSNNFTYQNNSETTLI
ncbi:hypothetical protein C1645_836897 [Glomus cerebriforme]|uniref:Uncharacterized protein n=1 Tax=Glomus cerebriforme TaxID=658196 RepID=A0A397SFG9_9GLOM|nr:hypothetical protein C1645_836897 [Glomus cerebriforme]